MSSSLSAKFLKIMKIPSQILTDLVACEVAWEGEDSSITPRDSFNLPPQGCQRSHKSSRFCPTVDWRQNLLATLLINYTFTMFIVSTTFTDDFFLVIIYHIVLFCISIFVFEVGRYLRKHL